MNNINIDKKYILEYIRDIINSYRTSSIDITNAKYHHNIIYEHAPSIINNGILCLNELVKRGILKFSKEELERLSNHESHVNSTDGISLAVVGLTDLYPDESVYDPFDIERVDFLISSDVEAGRSSFNYGNEYVSKQGIIKNDKIKSVDIRLLAYLDSIKSINELDKLEELKNKYNYLREIAISIKQNNLDIPIREMSFGNNNLDIDRIIKSPKLLIK